MRRGFREEREGAPLPGSGSGKHMRAQAAALLWELENRPQTSPKRLYRGSHVEPRGFQAWTESRRVARHWAKKNGGQVFVLDRAVGLRLGGPEREWLVEL
jgi:hypothetical protein